MKVINLPAVANVPTKAEPKTDEATQADFLSELDNKMAAVKRKEGATTDGKRDKPDDSEVKIKTDRFDLASLVSLVNPDGEDKVDKRSDDPGQATLDSRMEQLQLLLVQAMQPPPPEPIAVNAVPVNVDNAGAVAALPTDIDSTVTLDAKAAPDTLATLMATVEKGTSTPAPDLTTTSATKAPFTLATPQHKTAPAEPVTQNDYLPVANNVADGKTHENPLMASLAAPPTAPQAKVSTESAHHNVQPLAEHAAVMNAKALPVDTAPKSSAVLNQELGSPAWQNSLSQHISLFTRNGIQNAELRLHPQELGALQINLRLNNDQVQLHFVTDNHQVRAAIEAAMPHLRTTLADSGLNLEQGSVGADASSSGGFFSSPGHEGGKANYDAEINDVALLPEEETDIPVRVVHYASGINTFA